MENLNVVVNQTAGVIECNFDEIKQALAVQMSAYTDMVVTEDEIPNAKAELATLRKIRKAVDDKRKEIKRVFNEPLDEFENKVKELLAEIDKPIEQIDTQIKMFDEDRARVKKELCERLYAQNIGEYSKFLPYDSIAKKQWYNASYSENDIRYDISEAVTRVKSDISVIESLKSEVEAQLIEAYLSSGNDLKAAITRNNQYLADKATLEAKAKEAKTTEPVVEEKSSSIEQLDHIAEVSKMVKFVVSAEDASQVRELLEFSNITFREE